MEGGEKSVTDRLRRSVNLGRRPVNPNNRLLPAAAVTAFFMSPFASKLSSGHEKTGHRLRDAGCLGWVEDRVRTGDLQSHNLAL